MQCQWVVKDGCQRCHAFAKAFALAKALAPTCLTVTFFMPFGQVSRRNSPSMASFGLGSCVSVFGIHLD